MAKARRHLLQALPQVDAVLEVADARVPVSSRNPDLLQLTRGKPRVLLLSREDLADPVWNRRWVRELRRQGERVWLANLREPRWVAGLTDLLREAVGTKRRPGPLRAMVVGIPNVGKSTAINGLARRRGAKTGGVPGITRGPQWVTGQGGFQWLDTPGLLWPRLDRPATRFALAVTGAIPDTHMDEVEAATALLVFLLRYYPRRLEARYGSLQEQAAEPEPTPGPDPASRATWWLRRIGVARRLLAPGGEVDLQRAGAALLQDFRTGRLGRITLERPGEETPEEEGTDQRHGP